MKTPIRILRAVALAAALVVSASTARSTEPAFGWVPGDVQAGPVRAEPLSWGVPPQPFQAAILFWSAQPVVDGRPVAAWGLIGAAIPDLWAADYLYDFLGFERTLPAAAGWGVYHVLSPAQARYVWAAPIFADGTRGRWIPLGEMSRYVRPPRI